MIFTRFRAFSAHMELSFSFSESRLGSLSEHNELLNRLSRCEQPPDRLVSGDRRLSRVSCRDCYDEQKPIFKTSTLQARRKAEQLVRPIHNKNNLIKLPQFLISKRLELAGLLDSARFLLPSFGISNFINMRSSCTMTVAVGSRMSVV